MRRSTASLAAWFILTLGCVDPSTDPDTGLDADLRVAPNDAGEPDAPSSFDALRIGDDVVWTPDASADAFVPDAPPELAPRTCVIDEVREFGDLRTIEERDAEGRLTRLRWLPAPESGSGPSYRDFEYDDEGRLVATTFGTDVPVNTTRFDYTDDAIVETGPGRTMRWTLEAGRVVAIEGPTESPSGEGGRTTFSYDEAARLTRIDGASFDVTTLWNTTRTTRYEDFDAAGRPRLLESHMLITSAIDGSHVDEAHRRRSVRYEEDGRILRAWTEDLLDGELRFVETEVDAEGRLVRHTFDDSPSGASGEVRYEHDEHEVTRIIVRDAVRYVLRGDCDGITHPSYVPRAPVPHADAYRWWVPVPHLWQLHE